MELKWTGDSRVDGRDGRATLTDRYELAPFVQTPREERVGRYLRSGRVSDVTHIIGAGTNPWLLLAVDVTTDLRRFGGEHFDWTVKLYEEPSPPNVLACMDQMYPYDANLSVAYAIGGIDFCTEHAFLYNSVARTWTGDAAPPSAANVQTSAKVLDIDDYGRVITLWQQNDANRTDDDVCLETKYPTPAATVPRMLDKPYSQRIWNCAGPSEPSGAVWAAQTWLFDGLALGNVGVGFVTGHDVERRDTSNGVLLATLHAFDATYDAVGNVRTWSTTREDGSVRTTTYDYDAFALAPTHARVYATGLSSFDVYANRDAFSLNLLSSTDANLSQRGTDFDGFGLPVRATFTPPGGALGVLSTFSYQGFLGTDPLGRRIVATDFNDPVAPANVGTTQGRVATTYLDELGRVRRIERALGASYANQVLVEGMKSYDGLGRVTFEADPFPTS